MFGSLGVPELLLIFAVILIVFGPRRIPEIARTLGKAMGEFRKATDDMKSTIEREVRLEELKKVTPSSLDEFTTPYESVSRTAPYAVSDEPDSLRADEPTTSLQVDESTSLQVDESTSLQADESTSLRVDEATSLQADESTSLRVDEAADLSHSTTGRLDDSTTPAPSPEKA